MERYRIADLTVLMACKGRTAKQARPYLADGTDPIDLRIAVSDRAVATEYARHPEMSEDDWHYLMTGTQFGRKICLFDGLVLHASAVVLDGKAYLFCAPSGGGKSTHSALWLSRFPDAYILNDDKPALRLCEDGWWVWGTPWSGNSPEGRNEKVPLGGIALLKKGTQNTVSWDDPATAVDLYSLAVHPSDEAALSRLLHLIDRLLTDYDIPVLTLTPTPDATQTAHTALTRGRQK